MKILLQHYMWAIMLLFHLENLYVNPIWFGVGSWDLNRTIGWGWDISNFFWWNIGSSFLFFTIGYTVVYFKKRFTSHSLSLAHLILGLMHLIIEGNLFRIERFYSYNDDIWIVLISMMWLVFILNLWFSKKVSPT